MKSKRRSSKAKVGSSEPTYKSLFEDWKLKRRFFEPLVLLKVLSHTQGDRIAEEAVRLTEELSPNAMSARRELLQQLCRACDYEKGGATVTSMVLEKSPPGPVYWISLKEHTVHKVFNFLRELLDTLREPSAASTDLQDHLLNRLTIFATHRLRDHRSLLKRQLESAKKAVAARQMPVNDREDVENWIEQLLDALSHHKHVELCQLLYDQIVDGKMSRPLQIINALPTIEGEHKGQLAQHYIGRIASTVRASRILSDLSRKHPYLFEDYELKPVFCGQELPGPLGSLDFEGIARRMRSDELEKSRLVADLHHLNDTMAPQNLTARMQEVYEDHTFKLRVHAELALLEAVYAADIEFYDGDRYVACSKAACFCCHFYIRHHPGNFVQPACHNNLWLNWAPPVLHAELDIANRLSDKEQRDLVIKINHDIRSRAVEAASKKTGSRRRHPDSSTGISFPKGSIQVSVLEEIRERSNSIDSVRTSLEPASPLAGSWSPVLRQQELDDEDGGVSLVLSDLRIQ